MVDDSHPIEPIEPVEPIELTHNEKNNTPTIHFIASIWDN